jgi:hypothetical protein
VSQSRPNPRQAQHLESVGALPGRNPDLRLFWSAPYRAARLLPTPAFLLMRHPLSLLLLALTLPAQDAPKPNEFRITIERETETKDCTSGQMLINGEFLCHTIELPWKDNQSMVSSIPAGKYAGHLRYDKPDKWRIQLGDVPGRSGIQIHIGNYTREIQGCILVGQGLGADGCSTTSSKDAYSALRKKFYGSDEPNACPDLTIIVEVVAPPPLFGTWRSEKTDAGDAEGRFTLNIKKDKVVWTERSKAGADLSRKLVVDTTKGAFVLERANDDAVLKFLDFGDKTRQQLAGRSLEPSKLSVTVGKDSLSCDWSGIKVTKNKKDEVESVTYPTKKFIFRKVVAK